MAIQRRPLPYERIIFPLDFASLRDAKKYIELLEGYVGFFKVGLELFISEGPRVMQFLSENSRAGIFLDMKFHDIPETVRRAQRAANAYGAEFITVFCDEGSSLLRAAVESAQNRTKILGVTLLTSIARESLKEMGLKKQLQNPTKLVLHRAAIARKAGCAGIVCSGNEVKAVKETFGPDFLAVVPGVRPQWQTIQGDDQKRTVTPFRAIINGADFIVIGRPIRDATHPVEAAENVAGEIADALKQLHA